MNYHYFLGSNPELDLDPDWYGRSDPDTERDNHSWSTKLTRKHLCIVPVPQFFCLLTTCVTFSKLVIPPDILVEHSQVNRWISKNNFILNQEHRFFTSSCEIGPVRYLFLVEIQKVDPKLEALVKRKWNDECRNVSDIKGLLEAAYPYCYLCT